MSATVNVNGLTLSHRGSGGWVHNTLPDVCKTPDKGIPMPFQNEAYSRDVANGTTTVFADGGNMISKLGAIYAKSIYDEGGSLGGIVSGTFKAEAEFFTHSFDVFFEGSPACRLTDKMFMNHKNTVAMAGDQEPPLGKGSFKDKLCEIACKCWNMHKPDGPDPFVKNDGRTFQRCVANALKDEFYEKNRKYPKDNADIWQEVSYRLNKDSGCWELVQRQAGDGLPTSAPIVPGSRRLDCVIVDGKSTTKIMDMKFPGDQSRDLEMTDKERWKDYRDIAKDQTGDEENYETFDVENECNGCPPPAPVEESATAPAGDRAESTLPEVTVTATRPSAWDGLGTAALVVVGVAAVAALIAAAPVAGAVAALGALLFGASSPAMAAGPGTGSI